MNDSTVSSDAGDGWEAWPFVELAHCSVRGDFFGADELVETVIWFGQLLLQEGKVFHNGCTVSDIALSHSLLLSFILDGLDVLDRGILFFDFKFCFGKSLKKFLVDFLFVDGYLERFSSSSKLLQFGNYGRVIMYSHLVFAKMCENIWILNLSLVNKEICAISFALFWTFAMEEDITEEQWVVLDIIASEI